MHSKAGAAEGCDLLIFSGNRLLTLVWNAAQTGDIFLPKFPLNA
jgi:hypothetical protein